MSKTNKMKANMHKSRLIIAITMLTFSIITLCGCGGGQNKVDSEWIDTDTTTIKFKETLYGVCVDITDMNQLKLITDNGDSLSVDIASAFENEMVFGDLNVGDQVAVTLHPNMDGNIAVNVINLAALMGEWVTPNPLDGSGYIGIALNEGGVATGIDQTTLEYRSWRIANGCLLITSIPEGGGNLEETDTMSIVRISTDSLVLSLHDFEYRYGRKSTMTDEY